VVSAIVRLLPELNTSLVEDKGTVRMDTILGGWPVTVIANNCMRIGAQLGLVNVSLNIIPFIQFLDALLTPEKKYPYDVPIRKYVNVADGIMVALRETLETFSKYLALDGLHADISVKYKLEVMHYYSHRTSPIGSDIDIDASPVHTTDMVFVVRTPLSNVVPLRRKTATCDHNSSESDMLSNKPMILLKVNLFLIDLLLDIFSLINLVDIMKLTKEKGKL
jgi:hypothetical protein